MRWVIGLLPVCRTKNIGNLGVFTFCRCGGASGAARRLELALGVIASALAWRERRWAVGL